MFTEYILSLSLFCFSFSSFFDDVFYWKKDYGSPNTYTCTIYVPRASVEDYKSAETWRALTHLIELYDFDFEKFIWRIAATTACRMSVMANTYISEEDQEWILENIRYCDNLKEIIFKNKTYTLEEFTKKYKLGGVII